MMAAQNKCSSCDTAHGENDLFCENCGYDFITGSLPAAEGGHAPVPDAIEVSQGARSTLAPELVVEIEVSPDYFVHAVSGTELQIPDPPPQAARLSFAAIEVHIGRTSESRGIHPDIDVAVITSDPAVSSRHAVLRVGSNGAVEITDLGSTNGTVIADPTLDPIEPNVAIALNEDTWVYLGAWTRLRARLVQLNP